MNIDHAWAEYQCSLQVPAYMIVDVHVCSIAIFLSKMIVITNSAQATPTRSALELSLEEPQLWL